LIFVVSIFVVIVICLLLFLVSFLCCGSKVVCRCVARGLLLVVWMFVLFGKVACLLQTNHHLRDAPLRVHRLVRCLIPANLQCVQCQELCFLDEDKQRLY
jgi:hypothetical protein